jgi:hypothetical protein
MAMLAIQATAFSSDNARYLTGQIVAVNGGKTAA